MGKVLVQNTDFSNTFCCYHFQDNMNKYKFDSMKLIFMLFEIKYFNKRQIPIHIQKRETKMMIRNTAYHWSN